MASNPPFVRLTKRLTRQVIADLPSKFAISGVRVVPYPEDNPDQALFVRRLLARGVLEEASRAEYEEQEEVDGELAKAGFFDDTHKKEVVSYQEHLVVERQAAAQKRVSDKRAETEDEDETEIALLEERRASLLEQQEEMGLNEDDPEKQISRLPQKATTAKKTTGRKAKDTTREPEGSL